MSDATPVTPVISPEPSWLHRVRNGGLWLMGGALLAFLGAPSLLAAAGIALGLGGFSVSEIILRRRKRQAAIVATAQQPKLSSETTLSIPQTVATMLSPTVEDAKLVMLLASQSVSQRLVAFTTITEHLEADPHSLTQFVAMALAEIARSRVPGPDQRETAIELLRRGGYHRRVMTDKLLDEWLTFNEGPPESFRKCMCRLIDSRDTVIRMLEYLEPEPKERFYRNAVSELFAAFAVMMPMEVLTVEDRERIIALAAEFRDHAFSALFAPQHYVGISVVSAESYQVGATNKYRCEVTLDLDSKQPVAVEKVELGVYNRDSSTSHSYLDALTVNGKETRRFVFDLWSGEMATGKSCVFFKNKYVWQTDYFWPTPKTR